MSKDEKIRLTLFYLIIIIIFVASNLNSCNQPRTPAQPSVDSIQRSQTNEELPDWINGLGTVGGNIINEFTFVINDILNIPQRHFEDVRENHHYEGFLPTMNADGEVTQCTITLFRMQDGSDKLFCVKE